jgi:hypothetical protein
LDGRAKLGNCFQRFGHLSNSEKSRGSDKSHLSGDFIFINKWRKIKPIRFYLTKMIIFFFYFW